MFSDPKVSYFRRHVKVKRAERFNFVRQGVAFVMSQSTREMPSAGMVTHFDVTRLVQYGKESGASIADAAEYLDDHTLLRRAVRKNFSAFFVKAISHALYHNPRLNGFLDYTPYRNGGTLYVAEDINISFTVHTKFGVVKPIVRNPHLKAIEVVANEMRFLTRRARRTDMNELYQRMVRDLTISAIKSFDVTDFGAFWLFVRSLLWSRQPKDPEFAKTREEDKLKPNEVLGSTCTVANIGMMLPGYQTMLPLVPPELMSMGIGDLHLAPMVVKGQIVPRYIVHIAGFIDHRAFDGGDAFPLHESLKRYIDEPELIYEWKEGCPI